MKGYQILSKEKFATDHRCVRAKLIIEARSRYKNFKSAERSIKKIIPVSMQNKANELIIQKLKEQRFRNENSIQDRYNVLEKAILETNNEVGVIKKEVGTNEKITLETKRLIKRRKKLRKLLKSKPLELSVQARIKIECSELNEIIKKAIRNNIETYENDKIVALAEEGESIKKKKNGFK